MPPLAAPPVAARLHLRDATRLLHERVEASVDLPARTRTRAGYRALLAALLGLHAPLERRLAALDWPSAGLDFEARRKAPLLAADLRALGVDPDAVPQRPLWPAVDGLAAGFGCLYVLEGATLGGQIIAREVERTLGLGPGSGASFFGSYGREVGPMWRAFGRALDAYATTPERLERAAAAAAATFGAFERAVGSPTVPLPA